MPMSIETALEEHRALLRKVRELEQEVHACMEREAILKGRVEQLDTQLGNANAKADHYLRWCSEITQQMMNINMFVNDAMNKAKIEVETRRGNGPDLDMREGLGKAIGVEHEPVQREGKR